MARARRELSIRLFVYEVDLETKTCVYQCTLKRFCYSKKEKEKKMSEMGHQKYFVTATKCFSLNMAFSFLSRKRLQRQNFICSYNKTIFFPWHSLAEEVSTSRIKLLLTSLQLT